MILCQHLDITLGPVNSVQVNQVNYMYIQFTGLTCPPLPPASVQLIIRSIRWRHAWPRCATLAVDQQHEQAECLYARALGLYTVTRVTPPSKHKATQPRLSTKAFNQCCFIVGQRRHSWPNIETVLGECLVFACRTASYFYRSVEIRCSLPTCPEKHKVVHHHVSVSRDLYLCRYSQVIIMSLYSASILRLSEKRDKLFMGDIFFC